MMSNSGLDGEVKPASVGVLTSIDNADALALKLFRRARNAGSYFEDISVIVRGLHRVLKHLKVEAEDPESLLNSEDSTLYARQVIPMIEDIDFTLKQLDTILEKQEHRNANGGNAHVNDSEKGWTMLDSIERDKVNLIQLKLSQQKLHVDMFLDTIQLHNPSKTRKIVDTSTTEMEAIKDKVDAIATRLCRRTNSGLSEDEDQLWEQFRDALEAEGFSKDVLRKNQDVLRAYIRQIDGQLTKYNGNTPSVRGLLEHYNPSYSPGHPTLPYPESMNYDEQYDPLVENEEYFPSTKMERLQYEEYPPQSPHIYTEGTGISYDRCSSDDEYGSSPDSMALISTRDLMAFDNGQADLANDMGNMHLSNGINYTTADTQSQRYLPSSSQPALIGSPPPPYTSLESSVSHYNYQQDPQPRYVPALPSPTRNGNRSPPPLLHSNSISAPAVVGNQQALTAPTSQRYARLDPDGQGRDIPLDAKWTRIRRSLVSPEVLKQQGLRYEARPQFVAVLGELTREQISDLAKMSAEVRNARRRPAFDTNSTSTQPRAEKKERRPEDRYHPDKYRNWDVIEGQRDPNGGYVIDPQGRNRAQSTASSGQLWDSDDVLSEASSRDPYDQSHFHPSSYPNSYPPPTHPRSAPYHHSSTNNKDYPPFLSEDGDDKGTKAYPFIVSPPPQDGEKVSDSQDKVSPAATVKPKPILKNKGEDPRVRFDMKPQVFDESSTPQPRGSTSRRYDRDGGDRDRDRDKGRSDRDREREKRHRSERQSERERYSDRDREHRGSKSYSSRRGGDRDDYDSRRSREDRDRDRTDRATRKKTRGETLRAAGIGGAAVTLLSVLTEAAAGL
ncbi:hypothetical protein F5Y16DRAFT_155312 [Xylariaceae sp. FL0255]|nr:hypothetical protein F5Y16DRAFT_155312 [Xylariaceae sp. FL0255]